MVHICFFLSFCHAKWGSLSSLPCQPSSPPLALFPFRKELIPAEIVCSREQIIQANAQPNFIHGVTGAHSFSHRHL
jgi:hypothetical protein